MKKHFLFLLMFIISISKNSIKVFDGDYEIIDELVFDKQLVKIKFVH